MTVKRYTPTQCCEHDGTYVTYSDYQKLVAENAALKKFIVEECVIPHEFYGDNKDAADFMPETPATDAAIAELRAQGVDEFADHMQSEKPFWEPEDWAMMDLAAEEAYKFAANLRDGRKG